MDIKHVLIMLIIRSQALTIRSDHATYSTIIHSSRLVRHLAYLGSCASEILTYF